MLTEHDDYIAVDPRQLKYLAIVSGLISGVIVQQVASFTMPMVGIPVWASYVVGAIGVPIFAYKQHGSLRRLFEESKVLQFMEEKMNGKPFKVEEC